MAPAFHLDDVADIDDDHDMLEDHDYDEFDSANNDSSLEDSTWKSPEGSNHARNSRKNPSTKTSTRKRSIEHDIFDDILGRKKKKKVKSHLTSQPVPEQPKLVVGLDFGTTNTGVSYQSNVRSPENRIKTIMKWSQPSSVGDYVLKTPSRIAYAAENGAWRVDGQTLEHDTFGYDIKPGMIFYTWMKLLLDHAASAADYDDPRLRTAVGEGLLQLPIGKTAIKVCADFLRLVREFVMDEFARLMTKEGINEIDIAWICTVPAIWNDIALGNTKEALDLAGFKGRRSDTVEFVSEPEAGAVAALKRADEAIFASIKEGDLYVICDGGGGTVDLEGLRVISKQPLHLEAIDTAEGAKCGSTCIDREFLVLMKKRYGELFESVPLNKRGPASEFMMNFEREKKNFTGKIGAKHRIPFPALTHAIKLSSLANVEAFEVDEGEVVLTCEDMKRLFEPTVSGMCKLIKKQGEQIKKQAHSYPSIVILVGGLASSLYIWDIVTGFCKSTFGDHVNVLRPDNAWGAISYGACAYGIDRTLVISRVAQRHYLIEARRSFQEGVDQEDRASLCPAYGKRVEGTLSHLIAKGEAIKSKQPKYLRGFIILTDFSQDSLEFSWHIYSSRKDTVPSYNDDKGVDTVGELAIDLTSAVRKMSLKKRSITPDKPARIPVNIVVSGGHVAGIVQIQARVKILPKKRYEKVGELNLNYTRE